MNEVRLAIESSKIIFNGNGKTRIELLNVDSKFDYYNLLEAKGNVLTPNHDVAHLTWVMFSVFAQKEISSDNVYAVNLDYLMGKLEGERKRAVYFKPNGPFHSTMVHDQKFIDHPLSLKTAHF